MGFIEKFFNRTEKKSVPLSFFYNSGILNSIITRSDALDFYKSWVYACVAKRSSGLAQIEFKLYQLKAGKVVELLEHQLLDLLYRVNPETTKYNFFQLSAIYRDLLGASPWILEKVNPSDKVPTNMYLARPEYFKVRRDAQGLITGYNYTIGSFNKDYTVDEVIFLRNYNPQNPDVGMGIIEAVRQTAENDDYILQSNNSLLKNGARPTGYLETDETLTKSEIKRLEKKGKNKWAGLENVGRLQILQGGLKFKADIISPKDLDYIQGRGMNRDEIAAVFGVPKSLLTFDDVNRASASTGEYQFNKWTLEPIATEWIEQLNEFLVPKFGSDLWLDFDSLAKEDEDLELRKNTESWNKWRTINEIRECDGDLPLEGGDYIYMPIMSVPAIGGVQKKSAETIIKVGSATNHDLNIQQVDRKTARKVLKRVSLRNFRTNKMANDVTEKMMSKLRDKNSVVLKIVSDESKKKNPLV